MNSMIQCQHTAGATRVEVNSTPASITWNAEDVKDGVYTHSTTVDPDRITVGATAWYKITYSVGWQSQDALKKTVGVTLRKNGNTYLTPGQSYASAQNNTDGLATNFSSSLHRLTSGDYIQVVLLLNGKITQFLKKKLSEFVNEFENNYKKSLASFIGNIYPFNDATKIFQKVFEFPKTKKLLSTY